VIIGDLFAIADGLCHGMTVVAWSAQAPLRAAQNDAGHPTPCAHIAGTTGTADRPETRVPYRASGDPMKHRIGAGSPR
jgi:hypothetical protein